MYLCVCTCIKNHVCVWEAARVHVHIRANIFIRKYVCINIHIYAYMYKSVN